MIPVNNKHIAPCSPISSNCVIWQGPDIPCINLCNGDTVSDVVAKLGTELCDLIDATCTCNPDLTGLDLKCLPTTPLTDLEAVLQAIINKLCSITPGTTPLPNITLPLCLRYNDPLGNPVTQLPLDQFAILLGNKICLILSDITNIQTAIASLQSRVTILENCVLPCVPQGPVGNEVEVLSDCLFPGSLVPVSQLLLALESDFCSFRNAVGSITLINAAVSAQCLFGSTPKLSGTGNYGSTSGWVNTPTTLAESNINQWLVICDLYAAVKSIQDNCCVVGCNGVVFNVSYVTVDQNNDGVVEALTLNFSTSTIPAGFSDCGGQTTITITDSNGSSITQIVNIASLANNPAGTTISLAGLNTLNAVTVQIPFCMSDGTSQCSDKQTLVIPLNIPCPAVTATAVLTDINVSFPNALGTGVTYTIVAIDTTTGATLGSTVKTNPGTTVTHTFGGGIAGRTYNIIVTVAQGSAIKTCPPTSVTVTGSFGYVFEMCTGGPAKNVQWNVSTITPVIGDFYKWTDPVTSIEYCGSVVSGPQVLSTFDYVTGTADGTSIVDCTACIPESFDCVSGNCVDPGDGSGAYPTLADCQAVCSTPPVTTYNCVSGNCVSVSGSGGTYSSLSACQAACSAPPVTTYNCVSGNCVSVSGSGGTYPTLQDCQLNCAAPVPQTYNCISGNCVDPLDGTGTYSSLVACQAACTPPAPTSEVTGVTGYMEPCTGGTIDDYMGASVNLDQPVSVDTQFQVEVKYYTPGGSCQYAMNQTFFIDILAGNTSSNFSACTQGYHIPSGATICSACISACSNPDVDYISFAC